MRCVHCGGESPPKSLTCSYCRSTLPVKEEPKEALTVIREDHQQITHNYFHMTPGLVYVTEPISQKSKFITLLLAIFLGYFGAHYFYLGRYGKGVLYAFTVGLFGFGWFVDIYLVLRGKMTDSKGLYVKE